jgi:isochorismate pyruvate lyase
MTNGVSLLQVEAFCRLESTDYKHDLKAMKAPQDCPSMVELRAAIDELDGSIIQLLAKRATYIDRAAELKSINGLPANIPARVEEVVAKVKANAAREGFDPELAEQIWRQVISWSIAREERKLEAGRNPSTPTLREAKPRANVAA